MFDVRRGPRPVAGRSFAPLRVVEPSSIVSLPCGAKAVPHGRGPADAG